MKGKELLDLLAAELRCEYLSDLRRLPHGNTGLRRFVAETPLASRIPREWIAAAEYLCGGKYPGAAEATNRRQHKGDG